MSSTNKTTYYELSQYIGTDKPTYLGDYNSDMSKIDGAIHGVQETATSANQKAGGAEAKVTQVTENVEALKGRVGVVEGNISNLQEKNTSQDSEIKNAKQTADGAKTTANNALNSANSANVKVDSAKFNGWKSLTNPHSNLGVDSSKMMLNKQLNLIAFDINVSSSSGITYTDIAFSLPIDIPKPTKSITINGCGIDAMNDTSYGFERLTIKNFVIDTDGYLHMYVEPNSRLYCSGVFAIESW